MKLLTFFLFLTLQNSSWAFPQAPVDSLDFKTDNFSENLLGKEYDFEGIVKLSNCSGALIKFEGQPTTDRAIVLTNGHCIPPGFFKRFLKHEEIILNKESSRRMKIFKTINDIYSIRVSRLLYATMTSTDIALYELNETFEELFQRTGISPLTLSSFRPNVGTPIDIISGQWERGYSCAIDGLVESLKESRWTFKDSLRYSEGCDTVSGTSGSPIIDRGSRVVIGINNTYNEHGKRCTLNNPCEVSKSKEIFYQKDLRYGQQTFEIYTCLNEQFQFDLETPGCLLQK